MPTNSLAMNTCNFLLATFLTGLQDLSLRDCHNNFGFSSLDLLPNLTMSSRLEGCSRAILQSLLTLMVSWASMCHVAIHNGSLVHV
jgi:hypothetical protein